MRYVAFACMVNEKCEMRALFEQNSRSARKDSANCVVNECSYLLKVPRVSLIPHV